MLTAGPRATFGLLSPGDRPIGPRRPVHRRRSASGARSNCRAGLGGRGRRRAARRRRRLRRPPRRRRTSGRSPSGTRRCASARPAARSRTIIDRRLGDPFFGIGLNPGHQLHLDEWVSSPVWRGSTVELRSGMAMQVDIIPATGSRYFTTNIEDGIALADEALRAAFAAALPRGVGTDRGAPRLHARRHSASSSTRTCCRSRTSPAVLPPFLLRPDRAMTIAG